MIATWIISLTTLKADLALLMHRYVYDQILCIELIMHYKRINLITVNESVLDMHEYISVEINYKNIIAKKINVWLL